MCRLTFTDADCHLRARVPVLRGLHQLADLNGAFVFNASTYGILAPPTYLPWSSNQTENPNIL